MQVPGAKALGAAGATENPYVCRAEGGDASQFARIAPRLSRCPSGAVPVQDVTAQKADSPQVIRRRCTDPDDLICQAGRQRN
jgi:hypothetical protein